MGILEIYPINETKFCQDTIKAGTKICFILQSPLLTLLKCPLCDLKYNPLSVV